MYVSGSLKKQSIDFYKSKMTGYHRECIITPDVTFYTSGELIFTSWTNHHEATLESHKEEKIAKIEQDIILLPFLKSQKCGTSVSLYQPALKEAIADIHSLGKQNDYILLECLKNITVNTSLDHLRAELLRFQQLLAYVRRNELTSLELEILIYFYLKKKDYNPKLIKEEIIRRFQVNEEFIQDDEIKDLYYLGRFIAPQRLPIVAKTLLSGNPLSRNILPIYFAIRSDKQAQYFLQSCLKEDLNRDQIEKNATLCRVPNNLIEMVRR